MRYFLFISAALSATACSAQTPSVTATGSGNPFECAEDPNLSEPQLPGIVKRLDDFEASDFERHYRTNTVVFGMNSYFSGYNRSKGDYSEIYNFWSAVNVDLGTAINRIRSSITFNCLEVSFNRSWSCHRNISENGINVATQSVNLSYPDGHETVGRLQEGLIVRCSYEFF
jgi:hypothetical protein